MGINFIIKSNKEILYRQIFEHFVNYCLFPGRPPRVANKLIIHYNGRSRHGWVDSSGVNQRLKIGIDK